jgi:hypothetical protein
MTALRYFVTRFKRSHDFTVGAFKSMVRNPSAYWTSAMPWLA